MKSYSEFSNIFFIIFPIMKTLKFILGYQPFESLDPILVSGNTILIALDMYLGSSSDFYKTAPDYIRYGLDEIYTFGFILLLLFFSYPIV